MDANTLNTSYKSDKMSKVVQSLSTSVQKSKLYAIHMILLDFSESLNKITGSQYGEKVVLHTETAKFISENSKLHLIYMQL